MSIRMPRAGSTAFDDSVLAPLTPRPSASIQRELARLSSERLEALRGTLLRGRRPIEQIYALRQDLLAAGERADGQILYALTRHRYDEDVAEYLVAEILRHMAQLERQVGRPVSIKVAALDYFESVEGLCDQLELIEENQLRQLVSAAMLDPLTQAYTRAVLDYRLPEEFERARRYGKPLSLVMFDIDRFKAYNDELGHVAGDSALAAVGAISHQIKRKSDLLFRYGGEEFALLLPETSGTDATHLASRLVGEVAHRTVADGQLKRPLTISAGMAALGPADPDARNLLARADAWLYRAKQTGRNRLCGDGAP